MLKYSYSKLVFFVILAGLVLSDLFLHVPYWAYITLLAVFIADISYGAANIRSNYFVEAIALARTTEKKIALTFDDGPGESTPKLLNLLGKYNATATFFCIGKNIERYPEVLKKIDQDGHDIGNHTFSHHYFIDFFGKKKILEELRQTDTAIQRFINKKPLLFRPPYGVTNPPIANALKETKHKVVGWNIRSLDTVKKKDVKLVNSITSKIKPGAIILLHDHVENSGWLLEEILKFTSKNGYHCVGVGELLKTEIYG